MNRKICLNCLNMENFIEKKYYNLQADRYINNNEVVRILNGVEDKDVVQLWEWNVTLFVTLY